MLTPRALTFYILLGLSMWCAGIKMVSCMLDTTPVSMVALDDDDAGR